MGDNNSGDRKNDRATNQIGRKFVKKNKINKQNTCVDVPTPIQWFKLCNVTYGEWDSEYTACLVESIAKSKKEKKNYEHSLFFLSFYTNEIYNT